MTDPAPGTLPRSRTKLRGSCSMAHSVCYCHIHTGQLHRQYQYYLGLGIPSLCGPGTLICIVEYGSWLIWTFENCISNRIERWLCPPSSNQASCETHGPSTPLSHRYLLIDPRSDVPPAATKLERVRPKAIARLRRYARGANTNHTRAVLGINTLPRPFRRVINILFTRDNGL